MTIPFGGMIGRYQVANDIARGGFGTVFLARAVGPLQFSRWVALKVAHKHVVGEPNARELFIHEVQITSALVHANLCTPFDSGASTDGGLFLAMDYLRGLTFVDLINRMRSWSTRTQDIGIDFVARLVADAARGLHAAHEARNAMGESLQIVHRDVALSNLMLCFDGQVKVIDFGVARSTQQIHKTGHGMLRGHLSYLSPEQIGGGTLIDRRVDVWGLGVVLWELLAGRKCFVAETTSELMKTIFHQDAPSLRLVAPHVPEALVKIAEGALQRDRNRRTNTAREVCEGLELFLRQRNNVMSGFEVARLLSKIAPGAQADEENRLKHTALKLDQQITRVEQNVFNADQSRTIRWPTSSANERRRSVRPIWHAMKRRLHVAAMALSLCGGAGGAAVFMGPHVFRTAMSTSATRGENRSSIKITSLAPPVSRTAEPSTNIAQEPRTTPNRPKVVASIDEALGSLNLATRGGFAEVFLDGRSLGESPVIVELAPGFHEVKAIFGSGQMARKKLLIQAGTKTHVVLAAAGTPTSIDTATALDSL